MGREVQLCESAWYAYKGGFKSLVLGLKPPYTNIKLYNGEYALAESTYKHSTYEYNVH